MNTTPTAPGLAQQAGLAVPPGVYGIPPQGGQPQQAYQYPPQPLPFAPPAQQLQSVIRVRPSSTLRIEFDRLGQMCVLNVTDPVAVVTGFFGLLRDKEKAASGSGLKLAGLMCREDLDGFRKVIAEKSFLEVPTGFEQTLTDTEVDAISSGLIEWHTQAGKTLSPAQT